MPTLLIEPNTLKTGKRSKQRWSYSMDKKRYYFDVILKNEELVLFYNHFADTLIQYKIGNVVIDEIEKQLSLLFDIFEDYYPHLRELDKNRKEGFSQLVYKTILNLELFFEKNELKESVREVLKRNNLTQNKLSELINRFHKSHNVEYVTDIKQPHISLVLSTIDIQERQPELHWSVYLNLMKFFIVLKENDNHSSVNRLLEREMVIIDKQGFQNNLQIEVCRSFIKNFMKINNNLEDKYLRIIRNRLICPFSIENGNRETDNPNDNIMVSQWVEKQVTIKSVKYSTLNM